MNRFCRADVLRILHITPKQLSGWQRAGLAPVSDEFSFFDLIQLKKVRDLRAKRVRSAVIRESLVAMRKQVAGMENPLLEASAFSVGNRVAFRHDGRSVEPVRGTICDGVRADGRGRLGKGQADREDPTLRPICSPAESRSKSIPAPTMRPSQVYLRVLEFEPEHAAAHINLGTLYYNRQDFVSAEKHYRLGD